MMPPFRTPSKASYFFAGFHSATTSPFFGKLRICNPSGFAGPQPQQALLAAYVSWRDCDWFILEAVSPVENFVPPQRASLQVKRSLGRARIGTQFVSHVK